MSLPENEPLFTIPEMARAVQATYHRVYFAVMAGAVRSHVTDSGKVLIPAAEVPKLRQVLEETARKRRLPAA